MFRPTRRISSEAGTVAAMLKTHCRAKGSVASDLSSESICPVRAETVTPRADPVIAKPRQRDRSTTFLRVGSRRPADVVGSAMREAGRRVGEEGGSRRNERRSTANKKKKIHRQDT